MVPVQLHYSVAEPEPEPAFSYGAGAECGSDGTQKDRNNASNFANLLKKNLFVFLSIFDKRLG